MKKIYTFDSTLRDGMQSEKISFSVADKIKIVKCLDDLGVDYIEAGNPGSNIKDFEFFKQIKANGLKHSKLAAFGSTCKTNTKPEDDEVLNKLLCAGTDTVVIFGKSWDLHVDTVLKTTPEENLRMISDTIKYLIGHDREVFFDAEHFFDGYKSNPDYAMEVVATAERSGASCVILCDTNGGTFPDEIFNITEIVCKHIKSPVGIHCHDDMGMAVANSVMAIKAGAVHVQGTLNGIGERCGNANLSTIIASLQLKDAYEMIPIDKMGKLTSICRMVAEISNISLANMPYVSNSAFSHKAGMHINAVLKDPKTFEHVEPQRVGNKRGFLISEMSGKSAIIEMINRIVPDLEKDSAQAVMVLEKLKELEYKGYQFEAAGASLELFIRKALGLYTPSFSLDRLQIISDYEGVDRKNATSAMIKVFVNGKEEITAVDSVGPVHALDLALRKALNVFFPKLMETRLTDYKVRILDSKEATGATTRVIIETTDSENTWTTIGVSNDIIEASKIALLDALNYKLLKCSTEAGEPHTCVLK